MADPYKLAGRDAFKMGVKVWVEERAGPTVKAKIIKKIVLDALHGAIRLWHRTMMPRHFSVQGGRRYGYQLRSGEGEPAIVTDARGRRKQNRKYWHRKRREGYGTDPLFFTGRSMDAAERSIKLGGTYKKATGVLNMPRYFYAYRKDTARKQPDKAYELLLTTGAEETELQAKVRGDGSKMIAAARVGAADDRRRRRLL